MIEKHIVKCDETCHDLKEYLEKNLNLSGRKIKMLLKQKKIILNGKAGYWDSKLHTGDILELDMSEKPTADILPQNIPLNIIFEDDALIAVNKPANMLVHPTANHKENTLANALQYYFMQKGQEPVIRFLNRLDMDTTGVVVMPKYSQAHSKLMALMDENKVTKKYIAVVEGTLNPPEGIIELPLDTDPSNPIKRAVSVTGQKAVTIYKTISTIGDAALVELELLTGRTHQIRVHLSHLGNPIIGDGLYGRKSRLIDRQALHAQSLTFTSPFTGQHLELRAELPADMLNLIEKLKG